MKRDKGENVVLLMLRFFFLETSNAVFVRKGPKLFNLHFLNTYSTNIVWANV